MNVEPESPTLRALFAAIDGEGQDGAVLSSVLDLSAGMDLRRAVREEVRLWQAGHFGVRAVISRETTTHFKWLVGLASGGAELWLHAYKASDERRAGYADSIHNHRYSFASWVLSGGYRHETFSAEGNRVQLLGTQALTEGAAYSIDADELHRVVDIEDSTLTLVLQRPPRREFSLVYEATGEIRRLPTLASRIRDFEF